MKILVRLLVFLLLLLPVFLRAQQSSNLRNRLIFIEKDTIKLDTFSIVPETFSLTNADGKVIEKSNYLLLPFEGKLWIDTTKIKEKILTAHYRVFQYDLFREYSRQSPNSIVAEPSTISQENYSSYNSSKLKDELSKSGNISRGISVGNNQDMSVSSNLNLQLSGKISQDLGINASISDNNIPIQPDGNTQQIQDFDKIFIQLLHKNGSLIAGDFEMKTPDSHFLRYYKKVQGASIDFHSRIKNDSNSVLRIYSGAALSKGKYTRYKVPVIEGNQGPYKLQGGNHETYIIVIAGTEKVYLDGKLLQRGQVNDYIIDYNTAEITFTTNVLVTKDKRVEVEFEYSDRNYARAISNGGVEFQNKKFKISTHFYLESDLKNQSIDQSLSDQQKSFLGNIGDSIQNAYMLKADSVAYSNDKVLYKMVDTLGYDSVFVYSTHPDSAHYQLNFSNVGIGNGNYIQVKSAANGRVFEWIEPIAGIKQGSFEPIVLLITPKKSEMITLATSYDISKNTKVFSELAMSNKDLNTFSSKGNADNTGFSALLGFKNSKKIHHVLPDWTLATNFDYQFQDRNFEVIESFRPVEFLRDWNLSSAPQKKDQHLTHLNMKLFSKKADFTNYQFSSFQMGSAYSGFQNAGSMGFRILKFTTLSGNISTTISNLPSYSANFLRHSAEISQEIKKIKIGIKEETEFNKFIDKNTNSWKNNSAGFEQFSLFLQSQDSLKNKLKLNLNHRLDFVAKNNSFANSTIADEFISEIQLYKSKSNQLHIQFNFRQLQIQDTLLSSLKSDKTSLSKLEHNLVLFKNAINANTYFQAGTAMEVKKEFSYLEVAPGQGIYTWNDYNSNGVKELDEFEIAAFQDQANYIRVFIPTNEYIKTFANLFSTVLNLQPNRYWLKPEKTYKKILNRFSNQFSYRVENKNTIENIWQAFNPFLLNWESTEIISVNSHFRNVLYFNKTSPIFGSEISYKNAKNKSLLTNGAERNSNYEGSWKMRWSFFNNWLFRLEAGKGEKANNSEFFTKRNYNIQFFNVAPELQFQPGKLFRISFQLEYKNKENSMNILSPEKSEQKIVGMEIKYNTLNKGNLTSKVSYLNIIYNANSNDQMAYEMLSGLLPGDNLTWNISYQRTLMNNLQLSIQYDGRKSNSNAAIHVGSVQMRAYF